MSAEKLWTYQELAALFSVRESTIREWFRTRRRFLATGSPTMNTVRIPDSEVQKFIKEHTQTTTQAHVQA
jgi:hypothetical protein